MDDLAINGGKPYKEKPFPQWPVYDEREIKNVEEVIKSQNWWRVTGTKVNEFERKFAEFQQCNYCLGVTNGTSALQLALDVLDIGVGDEVIVPAMSFISTGLAVINNNATPVMVDVDKDTYCMNVECFEKAITDKTRAVVPVHMAGNACDMDRICKIAKKYGISVIEDAAHCHGGEYLDKRLGSYGDMSIFSFQNGKLMTCGEGGALMLKDQDLYKRALVTQDVGRPIGDKVYKYVVRGENYRMNEFQAAILLAQMDRVDEYNRRREKNSALLDGLFEEIDGITPQKRSAGTTVFTHYMYMFSYDSKAFNGASRDMFVKCLIAEGIPASVCFSVMTDVDFITNCDFGGRVVDKEGIVRHKADNAKDIADNVIWLHHRVLEGDEQDVYDIANAVKKIQKNI